MKIQIKSINRRQQVSTRIPGQTYSITKIQDIGGKVYSGVGKWTENWKEGDEIEVNVEEKQIQGQDGFPITVYNLKDPNPSSFQGRSFTPKSNWTVAYQLAIEIVKGLIPEDEVDRVAAKLKEKLDQ